VLPAHQRLRRVDDFATAMRRGRRAGRDGLVVHLYTRETDEGGARAGFVVPRAVGSAVTRNTVRRRLRHLLRDELARLEGSTDLVIRVLPEAAGRSYTELGRHLRSAIQAAARPRGRAPGATEGRDHG
jgi:ribonuclease P protein component